VIEQTQIYTTEGCESSGRGEMFRAVALVRQATQLLKAKASRLPDCPPGTRLQKIATGLGDFSNSLERAAAVLDRGHHRKAPRGSTGEAQHLRDARMNLSQFEAELSRRLRQTPIGSNQARQMYQSRERVRELLGSVVPESTAVGAA
jgi:hypothetical protein